MDNGTEVRPLGPLDLVRCAVSGSKGMTNLAVTITGLCRPRSFRMSLIGLSRLSLTPRSRDAWVFVENGSVHGLASIRQRSGPKSWEVSHLFADFSSTYAVVRLLERAAASAGSRGGERVFLRVEVDSPIIPAARLAGYFPSHLETVFRGIPSHSEPSHSLFDADFQFRTRRSVDDYALFRLYNAATPVKVRQLVGMTFDQWASSYERSPGRPDESVLVVEGDVRGWLCTSSRPGKGVLAVRLHPSYDALTREVVEAGLRRLKDHADCVRYRRGVRATIRDSAGRAGFRGSGRVCRAREVGRAAGLGASARQIVAGGSGVANSRPQTVGTSTARLSGTLLRMPRARSSPAIRRRSPRRTASAC